MLFRAMVVSAKEDSNLVPYGNSTNEVTLADGT
jgi:hypothetical protein